MCRCTRLLIYKNSRLLEAQCYLVESWPNDMNSLANQIQFVVIFIRFTKWLCTQGLHCMELLVKKGLGKVSEAISQRDVMLWACVLLPLLTLSRTGESFSPSSHSQGFQKMLKMCKYFQLLSSLGCSINMSWKKYFWGLNLSSRVDCRKGLIHLFYKKYCPTCQPCLWHQ